MEIIHGRNLIIKADGTAIAAARSCDVTITSESIEISTPLSGKYKEYIAGRLGWNVTTNQLVTNAVENLKMAGKIVTLTFYVKKDALPFARFTVGITVQPLFVPDPESIVYASDENRFFAYKYPNSYYENWPTRDIYNNQQMGNLYVLSNAYYEWSEGVLVAAANDYQLSGQALCTQAKITGTVGNLAQGSFSFQGSGPLE